jgi:hypothetical protein
MKSKKLWWVVGICAVMALAAAIGALAEPRTPAYFSGLINDYSPQNSKPVGPWEIRGAWSLTTKDECSKADFSAELTMEEGDYWLSQNLGSLDTPGDRTPHTHHITLVGGVVTRPSGGGLEVSGGTLTVTKDGAVVLASSSLTVAITGGTTVEFSNITLTFTGPATMHFGPQAIHGVVRKVNYHQRDDHDSH